LIYFADRSESARYLLEKNAIVGVTDKHGNKALSWMINKMPPVVSGNDTEISLKLLIRTH